MIPKRKEDEVLFRMEEVEIEDENISSIEIDKAISEMWGRPRTTEDEFSNTYDEDGWIGYLNLDMVLTNAIERNASDVHITADQVIAYTINGDIERINEFPVPDAMTLNEVSVSILKNVEKAEFRKVGNIDFSYKIKRGHLRGERFRVSAGLSFENDFFVFRHIKNEIPTVLELNLEEEIQEWFKLPRGIILFVGATGTGKTTSIASLLRKLQLENPKKIITIENPIEFVYPDDGTSTVVQREVGIDCRTFGEGLTSALRQNPDVILMGEVRTQEEVNEVLRSSETGHLTISTIHANNVASTINRIQSIFSGEDRLRVLSTLSDTLKGVASQILVKTPDGKGRIAIREILTINDDVRKMIANGDIEAIREYIYTNKKTLEHNLAKAINEGVITYDEGIKHTTDKGLLDRILKERN